MYFAGGMRSKGISSNRTQVVTAVGDKYVYEYMAKNGCRIGGEQSGHIIFSKLNVETGLLECYTNITIIFWRFYYAQN